MSIGSSKFYKKDTRVPMALIALGSLLGLALILVSVVLAFLNFKLAIVLAVIGALMVWGFGKLTATLSYKWIIFSGEKEVRSRVLYGELEDPDTAGKFKFTPDDMGGLFREGNDIVIGSLEGEFRCNVNDFEYEVVNKSILVNYLLIRLKGEIFALFPKAAKDFASVSEKMDWATTEIRDILEGQ